MALGPTGAENRECKVSQGDGYAKYSFVRMPRGDALTASRMARLRSRAIAWINDFEGLWVLRRDWRYARTEFDHWKVDAVSADRQYGHSRRTLQIVSAMTEFSHPDVIPTLRSMLVARGWSASQSNERRSIWRKPDHDGKVFVPHQQGVDFDDLLERALSALALVEDVQREDVAWHLRWAGWDRLQSRIEGADSLTFDDLAARQMALHDVVESVATAQDKNGIAHFKKQERPSGVRDYVQNARIVPSARGSFVIRALLPLGSLEQPLLTGLPDPKYRRFTEAIPLAVGAAASAAVDILESGASLARWEDAVTNGVTANLCDGLSRHLAGNVGRSGRDTGAVQLGVHLSESVAPAEGRSQVVVLRRELAAVLSGGHAFLLGQPEEFELTIEGFVTRLSRKGSESIGPGKIQVTGVISDWSDSRERKILVDVDEGTHRDAVQAYRNSTPVVITLEARSTSEGLKYGRLLSYVELEPEPTDETVEEDEQSTLFEGL